MRVGGFTLARLAVVAVALAMLVPAPGMAAFGGPSEPSPSCAGLATIVWFGEGQTEPRYSYHTTNHTVDAADVICLGWTYHFPSDSLRLRLQVDDHEDLGTPPIASVTYRMDLELRNASDVPFFGSVSATWTGVSLEGSFTPNQYADPGQQVTYDLDPTWTSGGALDVVVKTAWFRGGPQGDTPYQAAGGDAFLAGALASEGVCLDECPGDGDLYPPGTAVLPTPPLPVTLQLSLSHYGTNRLEFSPGDDVLLPMAVYNGRNETREISFQVIGDPAWGWNSLANVTLGPRESIDLNLTGTVPTGDAASSLRVIGSNGIVTEDAGWSLLVPVKVAIRVPPNLHTQSDMQVRVDARFLNGAAVPGADVVIEHHYRALDSRDMLAPPGSGFHEGRQTGTTDAIGNARFLFTDSHDSTVQMSGGHRYNAWVTFDGVTSSNHQNYEVRQRGIV